MVLFQAAKQEEISFVKTYDSKNLKSLPQMCVCASIDLQYIFYYQDISAVFAQKKQYSICRFYSTSKIIYLCLDQINSHRNIQQ